MVEICSSSTSPQQEKSIPDAKMVKDQIWEIFSKPISFKKKTELEKEVHRRHKLLREQFAEFDRIQFFHLFNSLIMECFYRVVDGSAQTEDFDFLLAMGFGVGQWADDSFNLMAAGNICGNLCLYCYITGIFNHYNWSDVKGIIREIEAAGFPVVSEIHSVLENDAYWKRDEFRRKFSLDPKKLTISWNKTKGTKLYMTPTNSDIFPENVDSFIGKWKELLVAGQYLLIVSKPRFDCIQKICAELEYYKERVAFRFTIGSEDPSVLAKWDLLAPNFDERYSCLVFATHKGFRVSISMEPFLSDPVNFVERISPLVDEIWIGTINGFPSEKTFGLPFCDELKQEIARVKKLYEFENIDRIVQQLRNNPKVFWKESIVKIYLKKWAKSHLLVIPTEEKLPDKVESKSMEIPKSDDKIPPIEYNEWRDPPSQFIPNQEHWCYGCNHFDGTGGPMIKEYPAACKKCSELSNGDRSD